MYIVLEGIVWTGKSTQSKLLGEYLEKRYPGQEVVVTREPGGTEISEAIRVLVQWTNFHEHMDPITEAYLYASSRAQSISAIVKPALDRWAIVISDRCFLTSLAYQGTAKWVGTETVLSINMVALQNHMPDLILHLDLDLDIALNRTFDHSGDKHEREGKDFFIKAHHAYHNLAKHPLFALGWKTIDASGSVEDIHQRITAIVDAELQG